MVGPDGRVTFSDKPPTNASQPVTAQRSGGSPVPATAPNGLPYELNQVAQKYPVTLYTSTDCAPCDEGRSYLNQRGIPYAEKTITTSIIIGIFALFGGYCLWIDKEKVLEEFFKFLIYAVPSAGGAYFYGYSKAKKKETEDYTQED